MVRQRVDRRLEGYVPPTQREMQAADESWFVAPPARWRHPVTGREGWQTDPGLLEFGQYVRRSRYMAHMTQVQLAKVSGVEQGSISRLERGLAPAMKTERLIKLSAAMGRAFPMGYCPHEHWCPWRRAPRLPQQPRDDAGYSADALRVLSGLATLEEINAESEEGDGADD